MASSEQAPVSAKKLIEVALPLRAINAASKADKDRKTGTIRNIHKWFAPMPVPAWRALLFAALVDDPGDAQGRDHLSRLIEQLVVSGPESPPMQVLAVAREEIHRSNPEGLPTVVDPFCGGGSTLVEAQRLGLHSFGSDLNPIPVLITRTLCELLPAALAARPAQASELVAETSLTDLKNAVWRYAEAVRMRVRARVASLYPALPRHAQPYAWIWTRTAACPNPACRLQTPLVASWCLSAKRGAEVFARPVIRDDHVNFEITDGSDAPRETKIGRAAFSCVRCETVLSTEYLRSVADGAQLGIRLLAVAAMTGRSRVYLAPTTDQEAALELAVEIEPFLRVPISRGALGIQVPLWGMTEQADLYLPRQIAVLSAFADEASTVHDQCIADGLPPEHAVFVASTVGLAVSRLAMHNSKQVKWFTRNGPSKADPALREANLPIVWTFVETNPFASSVGDWMQVVETTLRGFDTASPTPLPASVIIADARVVAAQLPQQTHLVATDPPYFSHIGYADLSDYFYVWVRRVLKDVHPDLFSTLAAPRTGELVANPSRHGGDEEAARAEFVDGFMDTFSALARVQRRDLPMLIVYAHREHEGAQGWEAMLTAVVDSGLQIVGTWPIEAARADRLRSVDSNALAAYVVMVCRPRQQGAPRITLREFDNELRNRLRPAVRELQEAATAPVDLAQAVIGPGMAVYSRNSAVLTAEGTNLTVGAALGKINRVLEEVLGEQETDLDPESRFAVLWFEEHGTGVAPFGEADTLARAKNCSVDRLVDAEILESRAGKVRLLDGSKEDPNWDPGSAARVTVWKVTQQLASRLVGSGEVAAAELLARITSEREAARELAYRLFTISERRKLAVDAAAYNGLVLAWPELERLAASAGQGPRPSQITFEE